MPRAEVGTPKYVANKMKAKGLQKLRWYCQMCQKQCRDENGFKCHTMSESHQRQILLFADNSKRYIDDFSFEFAKEYLQILRRQFGTKRVNANRVYQEYISDRNHLHMNATRWVTLTGFVKWLGKTGKCLVDETEKGWFIQYVDRDPETIAAEERRNKKAKMDKDDEERTMEFVEKQVQLAAKPSEDATSTYTELKRTEPIIKLNLKLESNQKKILDPLPKPVTAVVTNKKPSTMTKRPLCALDEIITEEESKKERQNRKDHWICEGIIVKILNESLGEKFHRQKGCIRAVENHYVAIVKIPSGEKVKIDQQHLETVIPALGKLIKIVNGAYRGEIATLEALNVEKYCVKVKIAGGALMGREIDGIAYEDVCKLDEKYYPANKS